jgi:hypothetical protein
MMTDFGLASATEGNSRENPWPIHDIDQRGFAIAIDFIYHPRFLGAPDKELGDNTLSPTITRAVLIAARLLCLPLLQAICLKLLAAQLTPENCLGALQLCLDAKKQWPQLEGQGEALSDRARQFFADKSAKVTEATLTVAMGENKTDDDSTLQFRLANCDVSFFEALFGTSFPVVDTAACDAFFALLLAWHRLSNADATATQLLKWLSEYTKEKPVTYCWNASAQAFAALRSGQHMKSQVFDVYGQQLEMRLVKDDRSTNAAVYLLAPKALLLGWTFAWTVDIKATADLPAISKVQPQHAFLKKGFGRGQAKFCSTAQLLPDSENPTYVSADGTIEISCSITSTSLVRLGAAFLVDHFEALMEGAHFASISASMIAAVLPSDELRVSSELIALQVLLKWDDSEDKVKLNVDMLECIRLSQINFKLLLEEMRGHECLQGSVVLREHIKSIVKKVSAPGPLPGEMPREAPRVHAKDVLVGTLSLTDIVQFLTEPSKLRKSQAREKKEPQSKLAAMEALRNDVCNEAVAKDAKARACGLLLRAGLRARVRLQARNHAQDLARLGEQSAWDFFRTMAIRFVARRVSGGSIDGRTGRASEEQRSRKVADGV